jgi:hypothetical protein
MKRHLSWVLICVAAVSVVGADLYRKVGGKVYPMNSTDWTVFREKVKVLGFLGEDPVCQRYTTHDAHGTVMAGPKGKRGGVAVQNTITNWGSWLVLVNCPYAKNVSKWQDILPGVPFAAMRTGTRATGLIIRHGDQYLAPLFVVPVYDYGTPFTPPAQVLTPTEKAAAETAGEKKKAEAEAVKLRFDQEQAEAGKDLYQYRLGMRYSNGEGVEQDLAKAREWLKKSADQGNQDAVKQLAKLPPA